MHTLTDALAFRQVGTPGTYAAGTWDFPNFYSLQEARRIVFAVDFTSVAASSVFHVLQAEDSEGTNAAVLDPEITQTVTSAADTLLGLIEVQDIHLDPDTPYIGLRLVAGGNVVLRDVLAILGEFNELPAPNAVGTLDNIAFVSQN